jgi:GntR family transcriptional regulator
MLFQVNFKSGLPPYLQLADQVKAAAASGALQPGEPLPSIRPLAEHLRLNRNTVAKAYAELEAQGVIETLAGKGCFLKANNTPYKQEVRTRLLTADIDAAVIQAHNLQVDRNAFLKLVHQRLDHFEQQRIQAAQKS